MTEKRGFSRVAYSVEATLEYLGERFASEIIDLSLKGTLINTGASPRRGDRVAVTFRLAQTGVPVSIRYEGTVARADRRGLGIEFDEMGLDSYAELKRIVVANNGDPEAVDEEFASLVRRRSAPADA